MRDNHFKLYHELASYYFSLEQVHREFDKETAFLLEELPLVDYQKILDIGCGTGEHLEQMRKNGYETLGIDNSADMIRVAKERFPHLRMIQDDMLHLTVTGTYDAAFSLFGTMNYLLDDLSMKKALRGIYHRIRKSGKFILEVWNAAPIRAIKKKKISNVSSIICNGQVVHRNRGFLLTQSDAKTLVQVDYLYQIDDQTLDDTHYMRAFGLAEIQDLLLETGFNNHVIYGDYNREGFRENGSRIIVSCLRD